MSRKIDLNAPLSDDDVTYLESRGRTGDILRNRRMFSKSAPGAVSDEGGSHEQRRDEGAGSTEQSDWEELVDELTVDQLREELSERGMDSKGNKSALQARLKEAGPPEGDES